MKQVHIVHVACPLFFDWFYFKDMAGSDSKEMGLAEDVAGSDSLRVHICG